MSRMTDLPSTEQAREALESWDEPGWHPASTGQNLDLMVSVFRIAQAYVDGLLVVAPKCPDCKDGQVESHSDAKRPHEPGWCGQECVGVCPSCGGSGVNPELVEKIAAEIDIYEVFGTGEGRGLRVRYEAEVVRDVLAALSAVFKEQT